jgi:hypothetical protein
MRTDQHMMMFLRADKMSVVAINARLLISVSFFPEKKRTFHLQIKHNCEKV